MKNIISSALILLIAISILNSCNQNKNSGNASAENKVAEFNSQEYLQKGKELAQATGKVLASQLVSAIEAKGTHQALEFCNIEAIPLTDSMSTHLSAKIKRVSDKYRNPKNAANKQELAYINQAKAELTQNGETKPKIFEQNKKIVGYYPIMTNALCLQCHGNFDSDINEETKNAIQENYPKDLAIDYKANELRGIWVIEMDK
jgi:outer membrane PBP1 activator LpoA protein